MRILRSKERKGDTYRVHECCWCGRTPVVIRYCKKGVYRYKVCCPDCNDSTIYCLSEQQAVDDWNKDEIFLANEG
jgi:transcription elongation factor Elf1